MSVAAFCACVHDALISHPGRSLRREARRQLEVLEKEIGLDIKVVKGTVRRSGVTPEQDAEALHAQLASLARLSSHMVVIFDEFQAIVQAHASGDDTAANDLRALSVLADRGGERLTSRASGILYGFSSHTRLPDACERSYRRGLLQSTGGGWRIVDPFFEEWLRATSPFAPADYGRG
jgi:hypothetical protein